MNRAVRYIDASSEFLDRVSGRLAVAFLLLMWMSILLQIIARYIFSQPPGWTEELARYAMIWGGLLGATVSCRRRLDPVLVRITSIQNPWLRTFSRWVEACAIVIFAVPVLLVAPQFLQLHMERYTDSLRLPSALVVAVIPLCIAIILWHAIARLITETNATGITESKT